jgi:orotate phosphoribosyltransferase
MSDQARQRLKNLILEKAVRHGDFTLSSGKKSNFYIDLSEVTLHPEGLSLICKLLWNKLLPSVSCFNLLAGPMSGADPIVSGMICMAHTFDLNVRGVLVRSKPKEYGDQNLIVGPLYEDGFSKSRHVLIDDVVTTGTSLLKAMKALEDAGSQTYSCILSVVDRDGGAKELFAMYNYHYTPLFTLEDLGLK